jgi:hypothetical protein
MNSKFGYIENCLVTIWVLTIYYCLFICQIVSISTFYILNFVTIFIYLIIWKIVVDEFEKYVAYDV